MLEDLSHMIKKKKRYMFLLSETNEKGAKKLQEKHKNYTRKL